MHTTGQKETFILLGGGPKEVICKQTKVEEYTSMISVLAWVLEIFVL